MNDYSIAETTGALTPVKKTAPKPSGSSYKETLDNIDMSQVKSAKGCLDGCCVSVNAKIEFHFIDLKILLLTDLAVWLRWDVH